MNDNNNNEKPVESDETIIRQPEPEETSSTEQVSINQTPLVTIPQEGARNDNTDAVKSPILEEFGAPASQAETEVFEEIPLEVCGQLYKTSLEIGFTLRKKGRAMRELPEARIKSQGQILYELLKKNHMSIAHIDLFMLGAGMMSDWKYMDSMPLEPEPESDNE